MAKKGNAATASHISTRGEASTQEFANRNLTHEMLRQQATLLLNSKDLVRNVRGLTPEDQTKFVDKVDQAYSTVGSQNARLITALGNLCSEIERLPTSAVLPTLEKRGNIAVASGGFTDIWRGDMGGTPVAIKAFRIYPAENLKEAKEILWKRVPMWMKLSHENILPFRGVDMTLVQLALVYDWGQNSNISKYVASHPRASRPSLLLDVAKGLEYLHSLDISHGDLKGANIIIGHDGRARLAEYGLAPINSKSSYIGTSRWLAPEIIDPSPDENGVLLESKSADVFAFGMTALEVFTGKIPFEGQSHTEAALQIVKGGRPEMPGNAQEVGLTVEMWKFLESCWRQVPEERPTMREVVRTWQKLINHNYDQFRNTPHAAGPAPSTSRPQERSATVQPRTQPPAPQPSESVLPGWY
ncbi:kinase-like protein [Thelephora ganbajun]|uniref:Kinase-like protein n=1 Tax=Thelephora ganbajun TaxID=370292 RepID=A0ACB6Z3U5_THEGA|nr:kinase-like protein [Thelephora ganbajun]